MVAGAIALAAVVAVLASPGDASPRVDASAEPSPLRIGMKSCAARGCHGAVDSTDPAQGRVYIKDGAYTTWLRYDPHARAYAVLLEPRSIKIAEKLKKELNDKPAHEAGLCLSCHATVSPPEANSPAVAPLSDGITCEACHGPAEVWQEKHLSPAWRSLAHLPMVRDADGMQNLATPFRRAKLCVECHVGNRSRGMDMNHDLIAAGHPRLNFEYATYLAAYPKHWKERDTSPAFEAKSWAIGQIVTAEAVLDLLSARALASEDKAPRKPPSPEAVWPEFSEYECFACHHDLSSPSPRQQPARPLGQLPWQTWPSAMLPSLAKDVDLSAWAELRQEMVRPVPRAAEVARLAAAAKMQLDALGRTLEADPFAPEKVDAILGELAKVMPAVDVSWDRAAQHDLALEALARAAKAGGRAVPPAVEEAIRKASGALEFPANYDSPRGRR